MKKKSKFESLEDLNRAEVPEKRKKDYDKMLNELNELNRKLLDGEITFEEHEKELKRITGL